MTDENEIPPPPDTQPSSVDTKREPTMNERSFRLMQANLDLCLNYVREMAKTHLLPAQVEKLEEQYQNSVAGIDAALDAGGE